MDFKFEFEERTDSWGAFFAFPGAELNHEQTKNRRELDEFMPSSRNVVCDVDDVSISEGKDFYQDQGTFLTQFKQSQKRFHKFRNSFQNLFKGADEKLRKPASLTSVLQSKIKRFSWAGSIDSSSSKSEDIPLEPCVNSELNQKFISEGSSNLPELNDFHERLSISSNASGSTITELLKDTDKQLSELNALEKEHSILYNNITSIDRSNEKESHAIIKIKEIREIIQNIVNDRKQLLEILNTQSQKMSYLKFKNSKLKFEYGSLLKENSLLVSTLMLKKVGRELNYIKIIKEWQIRFIKRHFITN